MAKRRSLKSIFKAAVASGVTVEVKPDGTIVGVPGKPGDATEFDSWEERIDAQNQKRAS